jgi:TPR repeat protein
MLVLALTLAQPVAAQGFKPDYDAGSTAFKHKDYATALKHFKLLAEQGQARASNALGVMYRIGRGVTKDYAEAARWYRKAADQGSTSAQNSLGDMYQEGRGVAKDHAEAARWYSKAAEKGDPSAQYSLGALYYIVTLIEVGRNGSIPTISYAYFIHDRSLMN